MTTHIINIGDELLIGQVVNTNASWMAEELNKRNIKVTNISVISDGADDIRSQLDRSLVEADVVLITGGLGPTKDDITKTVLCEYFGDTLIRHQPTYKQVERFFSRRGLPFTEVNQAQALVPSRCQVILNEVGTAPCMVFTTPNPIATFKQGISKKTATPSEKIVISMPGVPFEMKWLMQNHILPLLEQRLGNQAIVHKTILTFGIGESFLADKISEWEDSLPEYIRLAYLPEAGKVRLRLSAYGANHKALEEEVSNQVETLKSIIGDNIYGYDDDTIAAVVGRMVNRRCAQLATAESCTGGLISRLITEVPGSSAYFKGGIVAYSNEIKENLLGVRTETLQRHGAVSEETAIEMARGCLEATGADYAIATTGISGPTGATDIKPLGLVYVAVAKRIRNEELGVRNEITPSATLVPLKQGDNMCAEVICNHYVFTTTRQQHQERTANQALFDLYKLVQSRKS